MLKETILATARTGVMLRSVQPQKKDNAHVDKTDRQPGAGRQRG